MAPTIPNSSDICSQTLGEHGTPMIRAKEFKISPTVDVKRNGVIINNWLEARNSMTLRYSRVYIIPSIRGTAVQIESDNDGHAE